MKNVNDESNFKKIACELDYCIYNREKACGLSAIKITAVGLCGDCLLVDIDKKTLEKLKRTKRIKA